MTFVLIFGIDSCFFLGSLGMDCKDLNIGFMNRSPPAPPPNLSDDHSNQGKNVSINYHMHWFLGFVEKFSNPNLKLTFMEQSVFILLWICL